MCITGKVGVQKAKRDIVVHKVLDESGNTIFRTGLGYEVRQAGLGKATDNFDTIIEENAVGFNDGYGFTVFGAIKNAQKYKKLVTKDYLYLRLQIKPYRIPKDSLYEKGVIDYNLIGDGLSAIRCEKLEPRINPKEV